MVKKLSTEEFIPGNPHSDRFLPEAPEQVRFYDESYVYILKNRLKANDIASGEIIWELSLKELNQLLRKENIKELKKFPEIHWMKEQADSCWIQVQQKILFLDCRRKEFINVIRIEKEWKNFDFNEEKGVFAYTMRNGLYLLSIDGKITTVFSDKNKAVTAGQAASRSEFGITKGTFWSPAGSMLAFYKVDERGVTDYPLVCVKDPVATLQKIKYPMAGKRSQQVRLGVYNVDKNELLFLESPDEKEAYLTCISWSPDEKHIYLAELNRAQKECRVKRYSSENGQLEKILFSEPDEKYTEPQHPLFFPDKNPGYFVWQSRRDGFNHLYLYDENGNFIRQLTKGNWEVTELTGYDRKNGQLIFLSTILSPLNRNLCSVHLEQGNIALLTPEDGVHQIAFSEKNDVFIDVFNTISIPGKSFLRSLQDGRIIRELHISPDPYTGYMMPRIETGIIRQSENTHELYYRIVRPQKISPRKKYPVVFYVYGGPHVQLIRNEWVSGTKGFDYLMADAGYVVFYIDPRGSAYRGKKFEEAIRMNIGKAQSEDYTFAMKWLFSNKNYVDKNRVGVYGWSFGGFMATSLMLKTELFGVGVAGGAVIDWAFYEAMYTERYMEVPKENAAGYRENNLRNFIGNLQGDLLLIHCDNDPVVLWQHTLSLLKKAISSRKQVDYFVYPGYAHNVLGADRVHLMIKVKTYFDKRL
ncbi:MAG: S9 family peptidase [Prevotellaceae bacterium]|jgi:dipeptidyl aminopeptidase/acylaminoacyl peptidase|nr:S9 family peptidase [Prevotellaceae bacterium]